MPRPAGSTHLTDLLPPWRAPGQRRRQLGCQQLAVASRHAPGSCGPPVASLRLHCRGPPARWRLAARRWRRTWPTGGVSGGAPAYLEEESPTAPRVCRLLRRAVGGDSEGRMCVKRGSPPRKGALLAEVAAGISWCCIGPLSRFSPFPIPPALSVTQPRPPSTPPSPLPANPLPTPQSERCGSELLDTAPHIQLAQHQACTTPAPAGRAPLAAASPPLPPLPPPAPATTAAQQLEQQQER